MLRVLLPFFVFSFINILVCLVIKLANIIIQHGSVV